MSVVKSKRSQSELDVITKARELAVYTIKIVSNENNFPKRHRWWIANDIVSGATSIHRNLIRANEVFVVDNFDYELRRKYQSEAITDIAALLSDITIAYELFDIKGKRMLYWTDLIIEVQNLTKAWKRSDNKRYNK